MDNGDGVEESLDRVAGERSSSVRQEAVDRPESLLSDNACSDNTLRVPCVSMVLLPGSLRVGTSCGGRTKPVG